MNHTAYVVAFVVTSVVLANTVAQGTRTFTRGEVAPDGLGLADAVLSRRATLNVQRVYLACVAAACVWLLILTASP